MCHICKALQNGFAASVEVHSLSRSGKILLHFLLCANPFSVLFCCFRLVKIILKLVADHSVSIFPSSSSWRAKPTSSLRQSALWFLFQILFHLRSISGLCTRTKVLSIRNINADSRRRLEMHSPFTTKLLLRFPISLHPPHHHHHLPSCLPWINNSEKHSMLSMAWWNMLNL